MNAEAFRYKMFVHFYQVHFLSRWIGVRRKGFVIVYNACIIALMFFRIPKQARAYNSLFKEGS